MSRLRRRVEEDSPDDDQESHEARVDDLRIRVSRALEAHPELVESVGTGWERGGSRLRMAAIQLGIPLNLRR